jgi:hypothetical protein
MDVFCMDNSLSEKNDPDDTELTRQGLISSLFCPSGRVGQPDPRAAAADPR